MASIAPRLPNAARPRPDDRVPPPDYCNFGIVLRALLILNAGGVVAALTHAASQRDAFEVFIRIASVLEPATFLSLFFMCVLRQALAREPEWRRMAAGGAVAAVAVLVVDAFVVEVMNSLGAEPSAAGWFGPFANAVAAAGIGMALAAYFELRARAMSPALPSAKLQALQSRIRPHFLFNSLNAAMSLVRSDPKRAEHVLEDLADIFRVLMSDSRQLIPLSEEVALAQQYLAIEQVRLGDRLRVEWEIHRMPADHKVPPLLLQPLLENAVRHGIEPSSEPGTIHVRITGVVRELIIVVENTYDPRAVQPGNGMALANVRDRLMLLYDLEARMRAEGDGQRYRVVVTLPMSWSGA